MNKYIKFIKKNYFILAIILLAIIKQVMTSIIPIFAISTGVHDDLMMVNMADCLLNGWWLGEYNQYTLAKGIFYPLFLAFCNYIGISYINFTTIFYTLSCLFFTYCVKDLFASNKKKIYLLILYTVLLFNPLSYASLTFQRVYRNGMTLSQVLLIFGGFFAAYLKSNKKISKSIPYLIVAGIGLATLMNTREDGIWVIPFVITATAILIFNRIKSKNINKKTILIITLPIIMLIATNTIISAINYHEYGVFTTNELNAKPFKSVMKSIYSVKNKKEIKYVSVTREKLKRLYKMSPTLNSIKDELEKSMDRWSIVDRNSKDNEVEDGWFFWSLRDAVSDAGYYKDAKTAAKFYTKVSKEINDYTKKHNVKTVITMPSALMSPWRKGYTNKLITTDFKILEYVVGFNKVKTINSYSMDDNGNGINRFQAITNDIAYDNSKIMRVKGWIFSKNGNILEVNIKDKHNKVIEQLTLKDSKDVYKDYLKLENTKYDQSKKCRFKQELLFHKEKYHIEIIDKTDNEHYNIYSIDDAFKLKDKYELNIEKYDIIDNNIAYRKSVQKYVNRLNIIKDIYKKLNPIVFLISILIYIYITIKLIIGLLKKKIELFDIWLLTTSVLLSLTVLITGVSYNEIASCASITYMYLSGCYPLLLVFELLTVLYFIDKFISKKEKTKSINK